MEHSAIKLIVGGVASLVIVSIVAVFFTTMMDESTKWKDLEVKARQYQNESIGPVD